MENDVTEDKIKGYREDIRMLLQMRGHSDSHYRKILDEIIAKIKMKIQLPLIEEEEEKPQPKSPYDE